LEQNRCAKTKKIMDRQWATMASPLSHARGIKS
jgi:hypothetical protein